QVMDSSMPLIGEHAEEDRQLIADLVISKMTRLLTGGSVSSPQNEWHQHQHHYSNPVFFSCFDLKHMEHLLLIHFPEQVQPQPMKPQMQPQPGQPSQPRPPPQAKEINECTFPVPTNEESFGGGTTHSSVSVCCWSGPRQPQGSQAQRSGPLPQQRLSPQGQQPQSPQSNSPQQQRSPGSPKQSRSEGASPSQASKPGNFLSHQPRPSAQGQAPSQQGTRASSQQQASPHPQLNSKGRTLSTSYLILYKSQSLTNAFSIPENTQRSNINEDEAKAETIRNLRKSFASLFSD
uniref:Synapsin ATP-binding domain-containing protein n=1 Tax=Latimeria chalumnae TaxID=7897 RepID=H3B0Q8_LATCH